MVVTALDGLPEELGQLMRNVAVTVEHRPGPPGLLGLYQGIPLTSRTSQYAGVLPDRITIYRPAICAICRSEQEVDDQVRRTVIHEIARLSALTTTGSANSAGKTRIRSAQMRTSAADKVERNGQGARPWPCPHGQSAAGTSASRGRRLTGSPSRRAT
jgi:hypothetical protein